MAMADVYYFAESFDRNMGAMYREANKLFEISQEEFPEGTGIMILTEDPEYYGDFATDSDSHEVIEKTIGLSDEETLDDDQTEDLVLYKSHEMSSQTHYQTKSGSIPSKSTTEEDEMIARALRQLTEAKEKAADVIIEDPTTFTHSHGSNSQNELVEHLQHSTFGVQMATEEFSEQVQQLSRDHELND